MDYIKILLLSYSEFGILVYESHHSLIESHDSHFLTWILSNKIGGTTEIGMKILILLDKNFGNMHGR